MFQRIEKLLSLIGSVIPVIPILIVVLFIFRAVLAMVFLLGVE